MTEQLTEEQIAEYKEAFTFFDKDSDGFVNIEELPLMVRAINLNPTQRELMEWMADVDKDDSGTIDLPEFIALVARKYVKIDQEEELLEAFKLLDKKDITGKIRCSELKHLVQQSGEQFTEEEAEQLLKDADPLGTGEIKYHQFVRQLCYSYIN